MSAPAAHVVVVSDRAHAGTRPDATAPALIEAAIRHGFPVPAPTTTIVPDEEDRIVEALERLLERPALRLILTTGGTGAAPRDVTPEATRRVVRREIPGFGELMRLRSLEKTPFATGSRALAGTRGPVLIVNLPGSPSGAVECLGFVAQAAHHVLGLLDGAPRDCAPGHQHS